MQRVLLCALAGAVFFVATPRFSESSAGKTRVERFAVELRACQRAIAANAPGKCQLYGKIKIVDHHEDVKIKRADHHEDLRVKWVDHHASGPGRWKKVDHHEDYKVKFVDHHEDYRVKLVQHHEGCD